jgi:hypothetical protein
LKEKTKNLQNEVKALKETCKQLNDANIKLNDDITQTMRKQKFQYVSSKENIKPNIDNYNETKINKALMQRSPPAFEITKLESQVNKIRNFQKTFVYNYLDLYSAIRNKKAK